jgi:hypothetical protein
LFDNACRYFDWSHLLKSGQYCLALYTNVIELWCSGSVRSKKIHALPIATSGRILSFLQLPPAAADGEIRKFLAITEAKESFAWCIDFSDLKSGDQSKLVISQVREGPFPSDDDIHLVSAVDPMGWRATINSESLDVYTREVLITVSRTGRLQSWTTNFSTTKGTIAWLNLSAVQTHISDASLVHGTSERKVAMGSTLLSSSNLTSRSGCK